MKSLVFTRLFSFHSYRALSVGWRTLVRVQSPQHN